MLTLDDIRALQEMEREATTAKWIACAGNANVSIGWPIASMGICAADGEDWSVWTEPMRASDLYDRGAGDARDDALFIAALRNAAADLLALAVDGLGAGFAGQASLFEEAAT